MESKRFVFEFKELGEIDEVVIPPKREKIDRRYGFVRFFNVKEEKLLATKLDNIVLEGRKIFANLPRFKRDIRDPLLSNLKDYGKKIGEARGVRSAIWTRCHD